MTKAELIQKQKEFARRETRKIVVYLGIGFGVPTLIVIGGKSFLNTEEVENFFVLLVTVHRHHVFAGLGLFVLLFVALLAAVVRDPGGIKCPNCGRPIGGTLTLLTSNCGFCGERIVS